MSLFPEEQNANIDLLKREGNVYAACGSTAVRGLFEARVLYRSFSDASSSFQTHNARRQISLRIAALGTRQPPTIARFHAAAFSLAMSDASESHG